MTALLADIGGTKARFAFANESGLGPVHELRTRDFPGLAPALDCVLVSEALKGSLDKAALCVAGPVENGAARLTNCPWTVSAGAVASQLGIDGVVLVNDFAAIASGIPRLAPNDLFLIGSNTPPRTDGPAVVLGPGTGLGVALYWPNRGIIATEGGHVTLPAANDREAAIIAQMWKSSPHVSAEYVLSGEGLVRLRAAIAELDGDAVEPLSPAQITERAIDGTCPLCSATLDQFLLFVATVAGNAALSYAATGGVYLAGGILPKVLPALTAAAFRERFEAKGRFGDYLPRIPTAIVTHPYPAFLGLQEILERQVSLD